MKKSTHDYLKSIDLKGHWEFPPDFDWRSLFRKVGHEKEALEQITNAVLSVDKNVQDASFLTDIGKLDERYFDKATGIGAIVYIFAFRFSNFGNMFTVFGSAWEKDAGKYNLYQAINHLEANGFKYIPEDELYEIYDGVNEPYQSNLTWWIRYFDYL